MKKSYPDYDLVCQIIKRFYKDESGDQVVNRLNELGLKTKYNKNWSSSNLSRFVTAELPELQKRKNFEPIDELPAGFEVMTPREAGTELIGENIDYIDSIFRKKHSRSIKHLLFGKVAYLKDDILLLKESLNNLGDRRLTKFIETKFGFNTARRVPNLHYLSGAGDKAKNISSFEGVATEPIIKTGSMVSILPDNKEKIRTDILRELLGEIRGLKEEIRGLNGRIKVMELRK